MKDKWFYLAVVALIAAVVITASIFRWEFIIRDGTSYYYKLDRWTGTSYICRLTKLQCELYEHISDD